MASLDNIYELCELLDKDNVDYLVISLQRGKDKIKSDVFYSCSEPQMARAMCHVVNQVKKDIKRKIKEQDEGEEDFNPFEE